MNIEIFKRNIKLQELGIGKLSIKEQKMFDFLNNNLTNLNTYTYPNSTILIFRKGDSNVLEYDKKTEYLHVIYDRIWEFFESTFDMRHYDIMTLIEWWCVDTLKLRIKYTYTNGHREATVVDINELTII